MKIEIRCARPPRNAGSSTSITLTTLPSAGAMISRSPRGPGPLGIAEEGDDPDGEQRSRAPRHDPPRRAAPTARQPISASAIAQRRR